MASRASTERLGPTILALFLACPHTALLAQADATNAGATPELTASDIVRRAAANWGGTERLAALRTLRARITYAGHGDPVTIEIARPHFVRSAGGDRYVSVFDGRAAAFLKASPDREGNPREPFLVNPEEVKDWEVESAWLFPAFFDRTAESLGIRPLGEQTVHLLRVELPLGARVDYYVDAGTFLLRKAEAVATIAGTSYRSGRIYDGYHEVDGILFPTRMLFYFGDSEPQTAVIEGVEFDVSIPPDHFSIPEDLRATHH